MANLLNTGDKNNRNCPPNSFLMKTTDMGSFGELLCNYLYISGLVGVFEKMSFLVISVDFVIYFPMQKFRKMLPRTSSVEISPTMLPRW